ncbi:hypothetical protein BJ508DRAFT_336211 [Ascobolus immersus RN42]|uniref:Uncharacterized protein n=1 Tax=Ascobolus immersus RN42 TaxID=1160509 RepID=A0A3N4HGT4_ASCIM|nr:hypothetical protein BJ508DRAFT_336211 [Ascobolus immersus RN42]
MSSQALIPMIQVGPSEEDFVAKLRKILYKNRDVDRYWKEKWKQVLHKSILGTIGIVVSDWPWQVNDLIDAPESTKSLLARQLLFYLKYLRNFALKRMANYNGGGSFRPDLCLADPEKVYLDIFVKVVEDLGRKKTGGRLEVDQVELIDKVWVACATELKFNILRLDASAAESSEHDGLGTEVATVEENEHRANFYKYEPELLISELCRQTHAMIKFLLGSFERTRAFLNRHLDDGKAADMEVVRVVVEETLMRKVEASDALLESKGPEKVLDRLFKSRERGEMRVCDHILAFKLATSPLPWEELDVEERQADSIGFVFGFWTNGRRASLS